MDIDWLLVPFQELERQIGVTNTCTRLATAWKEMSAYTIKNCFFTAGILGRSGKGQDLMEEKFWPKYDIFSDLK